MGFDIQKSLAVPACAAALWTATFMSPAQAQDAPRHLTLLGIPSGTVAPMGTGFVTLDYATERPGPGSGADASLSFGVGFGNAEETIGVQLSSVITSTTNSLGDSGYFDLRFSRRIVDSESPVYLGFGVSRIGAWGDARRYTTIVSGGGGGAVTRQLNRDVSLDATLSIFTQVQTGRGPMPLMMSVGGGTDIRKNGTEPGVYAGIGAGLSRDFAASAAWYGDHAILGVSYRPANLPAMSLNVALVDVANKTGDRRAVFSVNYLLNGGR